MGKRKSGEAPDPNAALDFETAMAEVESIIERIETGQIGLEQSVAEYDRGAKLLRDCRERLNQAEQRVRDLTDQMKDQPARGKAPSAGTPPAEGDDDGDGEKTDED